MSDYLFDFAVDVTRGLAMGLGLAPDPPQHPEPVCLVQCGLCPDVFASDGSGDVCPACRAMQEPGAPHGSLWAVILAHPEEQPNEVRLHADSWRQACAAAVHCWPWMQAVHAERIDTREDPPFSADYMRALAARAGL